MSIYLAPADSRLTDAIASEGWLDDFDANQDMGYGSGIEGAQRAYQGLLRAFESGSLYGVYREDEPMGFVVLRKLPKDELAQFHGLVAPKYRRTIWAARMIQAVQKSVFTNGTFRLETEVLCRNERAIRLLRGLGFVREGAHRGRVLMDGKRETTETLRQLRGEWRKS